MPGRDDLTPSAAIERSIAADRFHADPALWISRVPDDDLRRLAAQLETQGPRGRALWGVPVAVKDNIDVAGMPTTAGCPDYAYHPTSDAACVAALRAAGALVMGKTNLDQFATGLAGVRSPYGVPRHVFDPACVPGGSSSGSGTAVAAGIVPIALGTDTAGSGRVPAAFGNIAGLKPTIGSISARGLVPACRSIDTVSVFAASVDDALDVARVMSGYDAHDPYARPAPFAHLRRSGDAPMRIGVADDLSACDTAVAATVHAVAGRCGAKPVDISPCLEIARLLYDGPWVAERTSGLRHVLGLRLHPVTRQILESGLERRTVDAFDAFHRLAEVRRFTAELFARYDALLLPTAPFCPTLADLNADGIGPNSRLGTYTNFVNLCDLAAIAVPAGFAAGLPVGVTVVGPAWSEGRLASLADRLHRQAVDTTGATRQPLPSPARPDALAADETALFCIGAHMTGLPLNGQVTSLGGRFLNAAATAPHYRLFALGHRPGMLRDAAGASIAGEVWALPTAAIGALLMQVPAPLGFGQVELVEGGCLGFLAEAQGVAGAPDITALGGWRAHLARS